MPNWCQNNLTVVKSSHAFHQWLEKNGFSLEAVVKPEEESIDCHTETWGTKWDFDEADQQRISLELRAGGQSSFMTAWSPPDRALKELARQFPEIELTLAWYEGGCWQAGIIEYKRGIVFEHMAETDDEIKRIASEEFGEEFDKEETTNPV